MPSVTKAILSPTKVGIIFDISKHFVKNLQKKLFYLCKFLYICGVKAEG